MKYVTLLEIGRKQKYIFSSNKLSENIGASIIIKNATEQDVKKFYDEANTQVIYEGGGNALYVFDSKPTGIEFAERYSLFILKEYPGIILYLVGVELDDSMTVKDGIMKCYDLMSKKKNSRVNAVSVIDFGKTRRCSATNLPAVPYNSSILPHEVQERDLSGESVRKYISSRQEQANYFKELLPADGNFCFPVKLDQLGRSVGNKSYIAVVHIDGNRMREKISRLNDRLDQQDGESKQEFDDRYINEYSRLSLTIREIFKETFKKMVEEIAAKIEVLKEKLSLDEDNNYLPIRPLIMAGDDICFVTDGRIGVEAAKIFLEKLQKTAKVGIPINACAGVAIVKSHFPFSRAYELAEQLCENGKNAIGENDDACYLDWHIEQGELDENLNEIRAGYLAEDGAILTRKPYRVSGVYKPVLGSDWKARLAEDDYFYFQHAMSLLRKALADKRIGRSKVMGFRDIAHKGKVATEYYMRSNKMDEILGSTDWELGEFGFAEMNGKVYHLFFDALEMMDMFIDLKEEEE